MHVERVKYMLGVGLEGMHMLDLLVALAILMVLEDLVQPTDMYNDTF